MGSGWTAQISLFCFFLILTHFSWFWLLVCYRLSKSTISGTSLWVVPTQINRWSQRYINYSINYVYAHSFSKKWRSNMCGFSSKGRRGQKQQEPWLNDWVTVVINHRSPSKSSRGADQLFDNHASPKALTVHLGSSNYSTPDLCALINQWCVSLAALQSRRGIKHRAASSLVLIPRCLGSIHHLPWSPCRRQDSTT